MGKNSMREWSFLTEHAVVLAYIARQPGSTAGEIASATGISERASRRVISDLNNAGYITERKEGEECRYRVSPDLTLCRNRPRESDLVGFLEAAG